MQLVAGLFELLSPAAAAGPVDVETRAGLVAGTDPNVGLAIMAVGLVGYAGCLCIRDRWWEWS